MHFPMSLTWTSYAASTSPKMGHQKRKNFCWRGSIRFSRTSASLIPIRFRPSANMGMLKYGGKVDTAASVFATIAQHLVIHLPVDSEGGALVRIKASRHLLAAACPTMHVTLTYKFHRPLRHMMLVTHLLTIAIMSTSVNRLVVERLRRCTTLWSCYVPGTSVTNAL